MLDTHATYQLSPSVVYAVVNDEAILTTPAESSFFGVNATGLEILRHIEQPASIEQVITTISSAFDVDLETCRTDICNFFELLLSKNMIEPVAA